MLHVYIIYIQKFYSKKRKFWHFAAHAFIFYVYISSILCIHYKRNKCIKGLIRETLIVAIIYCWPSTISSALFTFVK